MKMKTGLALLALSIAISTSAADFDAGSMAYESQNYTAALRELTPLANTGDGDAQFMLGRLYARGDGIVQDFVEAHKWYNLAAANGQRRAAAARDVIAKLMTAEQIAKAQGLARDWQADATGTAETTPTVKVSPLPVTPSGDFSETAVARIQLELKRLGYGVAAIDGKLTEDTREAIRQYQNRNSLTVDGQPTQQLLDHLSSRQDTQPAIKRGQPGQTEEDNSAWKRLL